MMSGIRPERCGSVAILAVCGAAILFAAGCGGKAPETPVKAYEALLDAARKRDMAALLKCVDPKTAEFLRMVRKHYGEEQAFNCVAGGVARLDTLDMTITSSDTEGDVAQVVLSWEQEGRPQHAQVVAVRHKGGWAASVFHGLPDDVADGMIEAMKRQK